MLSILTKSLSQKRFIFMAERSNLLQLSMLNFKEQDAKNSIYRSNFKFHLRLVTEFDNLIKRKWKINLCHLLPFLWGWCNALVDSNSNVCSSFPGHCQDVLAWNFSFKVQSTSQNGQGVGKSDHNKHTDTYTIQHLLSTWFKWLQCFSTVQSLNSLCLHNFAVASSCHFFLTLFIKP